MGQALQDKHFTNKIALNVFKISILGCIYRNGLYCNIFKHVYTMPPCSCLSHTVFFLRLSLLLVSFLVSLYAFMTHVVYSLLFLPPQLFRHLCLFPLLLWWWWWSWWWYWYVYVCACVCWFCMRENVVFLGWAHFT